MATGKIQQRKINVGRENLLSNNLEQVKGLGFQHTNGGAGFGQKHCWGNELEAECGVETGGRDGVEICGSSIWNPCISPVKE